MYEAQKKRLFALYEKHPELVHGDHKKGEIEVVIDPDRVKAIEETARKALLSKGHSEAEALEWSRVGIVSQDAFLLQLRDAVIFPSGITGLYNRQVSRVALNGTQCGSVALPLLRTGNSTAFLFQCQFRHATGSREIEVARGFSKPNEPPVQTVTRELEAETGKKCDRPISLGEVTPNTGVSADVASIYLCPITGTGIAQVGGREAIQKRIPLSPQQVSNAVARGYIEYDGVRIPFRDGFTLAALAKAHVQGHIDLPTAEK
jgi:ADP-ribose pyrophosphatase